MTASNPLVEQAKHYDVIIVGTGSGNAIPAPEFDGLKIALVEQDRFGGTCLNVGCIPTKMFVLAADAARIISEAAKLGVHGTLNSIDWPSIQKRVFADRIDPIAAGGEAYRRGPEQPHIDVYDQHARFVAPKVLAIGAQSKDGADKQTLITADHIIIAAGSRTTIPQFVADSGVKYYTNKDIMRIPELPKKLVILGGGFIGTEFAHVFSSFGTEVHVVVRSGAMNRQSDPDISARFTEVASQDWHVHLNTQITALEPATSQADGAEDAPENAVRIALDDGTEIIADAFLVASGRTPNGDLMDPDLGGVELDEAGRIAVDEFGRTSVEGVWALGDVSSPYQLKHIANHEAKVVFANVLASIEQKRPQRTFDHRVIPSAVFSHPQIGQAGMTEPEAKQWAEANGTELTVKIQNYSDVAYGWALEDKHGFAKLIADKNTGQLLGAHFIGEQAATLIQQCVQMMALKLDVREVVSGQHWIHPALPELIENAILGLEFNGAT